MRKRGRSEPTEEKVLKGPYENFEAFTDNVIYLSNLCKVADDFMVKNRIRIVLNSKTAQMSAFIQQDLLVADIRSEEYIYR
jgi:hypothetical protein